MSARSYERFVTLIGSDAYWLKGKARPRQGADTPAAAKRRSTPAVMPKPHPLPERTKLACFVLPRAGKMAGHASVAALGSLADGTALVVVRELFSDPESLLRYVVEYPGIATLATDPRGLLAIPAKAYAGASRAASYDELVAKHASKRSKPPGHYWLKVSDLEALKKLLDGARDDAWDRSHGVTRDENA